MSGKILQRIIYSFCFQSDFHLRWNNETNKQTNPKSPLASLCHQTTSLAFIVLTERRLEPEITYCVFNCSHLPQEMVPMWALWPHWAHTHWTLLGDDSCGRCKLSLMFNKDWGREERVCVCVCVCVQKGSWPRFNLSFYVSPYRWN